MTAGSTCSWIATPSASWITVTAGGNGTGNGTVAFVVKPNNATPVRTAKLTTGPWVVAVQQAGKPRRTK